MAIRGSDGSITLTTVVDTLGLKKGLATMGKMTAATSKAFLAIGAAASVATAAITKQAVSAYADYEQLVGGVETLFKGSAKKVIDYASDAFATTGQSANEYMKNVTAFSASLLSAVGGDTEKAADIANAAMISISDNVNKMGSSVESVQMAFQGFAKQQYMLLDNLKLGYGGTKTEMERLLKDAQAITGVEYNIDNLADVYTAIGVIQEKLGIAGTTAKEAATTISGSAAMMKAAWQNVLTAVAGGGDLDKAINNLVFSVSKYFENIVPVVQRSLMGIGELIAKIAPLVVQTVATALIQSIPSLMSAIYKMIIGFGKGIVDGIKALFTGKSGSVEAQIKTSANNIAETSKGASESISGMGDAAEEAGKKAEKYLAGFDEITTIGTKAAEAAEIPDVSVGNAEIDVSGLSENVKEIEQSSGVFEKYFKKIADSAKPSIKALKNLAEKLKPIKDFSAKALKGFYEDVLVPIGKWVLGEGFPKFVNIISNTLSNVNWQTLLESLQRLWVAVSPFAEKIGEGLLWFFENVITPLVEWTMENLIPESIDLITAAIQFLDEIITAAEPALLWFWDTFLVPIRDYAWDSIISFISILTATFKGLTDWARNNQGTVEKISKTILGFLAGVWIYNTTKNLIDFVKKLGRSFLSLGEKMAEGGLKGAFFAAAVGILAAGIITLGQNWDKMTPAEKAITILGGLAAAATAAAIAIGVFHTAWSVGAAAAAIAGGLALLGLTFAFSDTGDTGDAAMASANSFYSSYDWNKDFKLPALAKGTVVPPNKQFAAILGDNTKEHEIVSPISTMKQAFMEAMTEMNGAGQPTKEEHYYLNETELMRIVYRLFKGGERLTGDSLI